MTNDNESLDVNNLEQIIADHNKEMRTDMASEITGGTRSKAITDVITVKAILDWRNKQVEAVLDRLEQEQDGMYDDYHDLWVDIVPMSAIQAERAKLKEVK